MATLAQRVTEAAKPHGSLRKAALSWGLPVRTVYEWGTGSALPGRTACAALAPILGLTASDLVALVDAERHPQPPGLPHGSQSADMDVGPTLHASNPSTHIVRSPA